MEELKNKAEAVLFSVGKKIDISEITKLCRVREPAELESVLRELQKDYEERESSLIIINEGTKWFLTVRERHMSLVRRIVADTELSKTMMETLAVIAWKQPIIQSEVIKIRTNKAYEHIKQLQEMGFLTTKKHGRTKTLSLTEKFFNYFELSGEQDIKKFFAKVKEQAEIPSKEEETRPVKLETYGAEEKTTEEGADEEKKKLGGLEIVDESAEETSKEEQLEEQDISEEDVKKPETEVKEEHQKEESETEKFVPKEDEAEEEIKSEKKSDIDSLLDAETVIAEKEEEKQQEETEKEET